MFKCMSFAKCNKHVEAIDKRHQNLTSFPDDVIRYYRTLEELLLDSNQLNELPKGFYKLTQLRKLDISDNEIERLSPEIGNFTNLVEFCCNRNDLQEIPESIKYCKSIQVLDLSNNPLQCLPHSLTQLKALVELTLNDLSLSFLPEDIGNLINLKSLQSRDNLLKIIPDSLCNIQKLESLDLGSNEIEEIPALIGNLSNLKELWLDLNQIKAVPIEIGNLKRLQYLELSENMLETLPDQISGCLSLTDLHLTQNSIEFLPSSIGELQSLHILKLEQNQLVVLSSNIGKCHNLSELVLTENLLSEIPHSIGNLKTLTNLNLDRNRLANIPDEICECEKLGLLSLRDNQLSSLPEKLGKLQKLRVLDVAGNKLPYLPYSLVEGNINAIWLAENQATGQIKLQPDFDDETQKEVLTCYLLPQQNYHTPSMENLLQGSVNTEIASQCGPTTEFNQDNKQGNKQAESVRFAPESDNEDKPSHFIRTNTPHPKELMKKKELLKQKHSSSKAQSFSEKEQENVVLSSSAVKIQDSFPLETSTKIEHEVKAVTDISESVLDKNFEQADDEVNQAELINSSTISSTNSVQEKHVGFTSSEVDLNSNTGVCRLRRHDTPHHLKGARINSNKANLAPDEMKEILQRYKTPVTLNENIETLKSDPIQQKYGINSDHEDNNLLNKIINIQVEINREEGKSLGISIAGGKHINNYEYEEDSDTAVVVTKLVPNGLAFSSGLNVGDTILRVNGSDLNNFTHKEVVELLSKDEKSLKLIIQQKIDETKIAYIDLTEFEQYHFSNINVFIDKQTNNYIIKTVSSTSSPFNLEDIILQINGKNIDLMTDVEIEKYFCLSNLSCQIEFNINSIKSITVYRPFIQQLKRSHIENKNTIDNKIVNSIVSCTKEPEITSYNSPIDSSTPLKDKTNQSIHHFVENIIEDIKIIKINGAMGLSIVGGGSVPCHPYGINEPGIFISKIATDGAASRTNLRIGDRILKVNGVNITNSTSHDETVEELKRYPNEVVLTVKHEPQPNGLTEINLTKPQPEDPLGIRIHGGIENKSANPNDSSDEGIFIIDVIPGSIASVDGRLQVGTRILEVNGQSLLGVKLSEAQSYLVKPTSKVHMVICDGFNVNKPIQAESYQNSYKPFPSPPPVEESSNQKSSSTKKLTVSSNYDNLRNIDSDDSLITSPQRNSILAKNNKNKSDSQDINDKTLLNIFKKNQNNISSSEIINTNNSLISKEDSNNESARSFKDKMKFFETVKERENSTKQKTKFSYLQEHEIQSIKQEEEKKMQNMSHDEMILRSRLEIGDDITSHKDYATFFSSSIDGYDALTGSQPNIQKNN